MNVWVKAVSLAWPWHTCVPFLFVCCCPETFQTKWVLSSNFFGVPWSSYLNPQPFVPDLSF